VTFESYKINLPSEDYIDTIKESNHVRYVYYGVGTEYKGTIFTDLRNKTISDNTPFYNNSTIDEAIESLESNYFVIVIFWVLWIIFICIIVYGFYCLDNNWLE